MKTTYTESFREQALGKVYRRGERTVQSIATELNMSYHTLKNWMRAEKQHTQQSPEPGARRPAQWSNGERLQALLETHGLDEEARNGWCRAHGVYPQHLQTWRETIAQGDTTTSTAMRSELRELKEENQRLERELNRKNKALAEAAALLVLQKKYQALWEDKDG
jgi:transposase-like protein